MEIATIGSHRSAANFRAQKESGLGRLPEIIPEFGEQTLAFIESKSGDRKSSDRKSERPPERASIAVSLGAQPQSSSLSAGKTVCRGAGMGASPFWSRHSTRFNRVAPAASGREKSILDEIFAPGAVRLLTS
jgi:hypothetical protein